MNIIKKSPDSYGIYKVGPTCHRIVKNLKNYTGAQEAIGDLMKLLDGEITERDLLGDNYEQEVAAGKLGNRINVLEAALEGIRDNLVQVIGDNDRLEKAARETIKRISDLVE